MSALMAAVRYNRDLFRRDAYEWLLRNGAGGAVDELLARMLASLASGIGSMPTRLGLSEESFEAFMAHYLSPVSQDLLAAYGEPVSADREPEIQELEALFLAHAQPLDREAAWFARILAAGCMGSNHLWQDLGLWSRTDLTALINHRFAALAAKNTKDMKWKKFFYKQLCIQEGVYTCRAPSCQVCEDYEACFGPE